MSKPTPEMALEQAQSLDSKANQNLDHIPGHNGLPFIGDAFPFMDETHKYLKGCFDKYGPVFRTRTGPVHAVHLVHPDAQQMLTLDPERNFSVSKGYEGTLADFFPNGLLLMDYSDHRKHRRIMQSAFKNAMLETYMAQIHEVVRSHIEIWKSQDEIKFVDAIKECLLEVGSKVFLGLEMGPDSDKINKAFVDMVLGASVPFRVNFPGTQYNKATKGYEWICNYFTKMIPEKRASDGTDMFSLLCKEKQEDGSYFSDEDIVHHVNFLLFAAHDTTTSTLSTLMYEFLQHPEWKEKCRAEMQAIDKDHLVFADLDGLEMTGYCFKETLRLYPPVVGIGRRNIREFEFLGHTIPANTMVSASPLLTHRLPEIYTNPNDFDPLRFAPEREEHKVHPFAWFPFGGGAHKCIGLHFAEMLVKVTLFEVLRNCEFEANDLKDDFKWIPFPKPTNHLPVKVTALA